MTRYCYSKAANTSSDGLRTDHSINIQTARRRIISDDKRFTSRPRVKAIEQESQRNQEASHDSNCAAPRSEFYGLLSHIHRSDTM